MNCPLLDDEDYEEDIARMIPLWIAEGQKEFTDNLCRAQVSREVSGEAKSKKIP